MRDYSDYRPTKAAHIYADIRTGSAGTAITVRPATGDWMLSRGTTRYSPRLPGVAMSDRYAEDVLRSDPQITLSSFSEPLRLWHRCVALATSNWLGAAQKSNKLTSVGRPQSRA